MGLRDILNSSQGFQCDKSGSYPSPEFQIKIGGKKCCPFIIFPDKVLSVTGYSAEGKKDNGLGCS